MFNFDYSLEAFESELDQEVDKSTLEDLFTLCRDNIVDLTRINRFVKTLELVSLDTMLHTFDYRSLEDILDAEPVRQIGDRWLI